MLSEQPERYWAYKVEAAPGVPPPDSNMTMAEWLKLTPGYRREIWRDWERRCKPIGD
jgi:hypothetical protein